MADEDNVMDFRTYAAHMKKAGLPATEQGFEQEESRQKEDLELVREAQPFFNRAVPIALQLYMFTDMMTKGGGNVSRLTSLFSITLEYIFQLGFKAGKEQHKEGGTDAK